MHAWSKDLPIYTELKNHDVELFFVMWFAHKPIKKYTTLSSLKSPIKICISHTIPSKFVPIYWSITHLHITAICNQLRYSISNSIKKYDYTFYIAIISLVFRLITSVMKPPYNMHTLHMAGTLGHAVCHLPIRISLTTKAIKTNGIHITFIYVIAMSI